MPLAAVDRFSRRWSRYLKLSGWGVLAAALYSLWILVPPWFDYLAGDAVRGLSRESAVLALDLLLILHLTLLALAAFGIVVLGWITAARVSGRRSPARPNRLGRLAAPSLAAIVSLGLVEAGAAVWRAKQWHGPRLPDTILMAKPQDTPPPPPVPDRFGPLPGATAKPPMRILVLGESSAKGEPYHPWLSVGQIVGWKLERVFPGRPIEVDIWAYGGANLEAMHKKLAGLAYRPDAMIVYVGHNEFQARYPWTREVEYYLDEDHLDSPQAPPFRAASAIARFSPFERLTLDARDQRLVDLRPVREPSRQLVDRPCCTTAERQAILENFAYRLDAIAEFCDAIGTTPIYIIPPCNDAGFDPSRSILEPGAPRAERLAFADQLEQALALETRDRAAEETRLEALVERHPLFAETHYQLARLLEKRGLWSLAKRHFELAREDDALPLRCPDEFRQAYQATAKKHPRMILIDGPKALEKASRHGILGDQFFHDAQHPNLRGYAVLSQAVLDRLAARGALDWPAGVKAPRVDAQACARRFQIDAPRWAEICRREAWFHGVTAAIRHDPRQRARKAARYTKANQAIRAGADPATADIPGWPFPPPPPKTREIPLTISTIPRPLSTTAGPSS